MTNANQLAFSLAQYAALHIDNRTPSRPFLNECAELLKTQAAQIAQLQAEVEELRKDSARLDWIIDNASSAGGGNGFTLKVFIPVDCECVRTAIDAAITKDISCYVSKDGDTAIRMLRTDAQELQRQTKDTHDWFEPLCYLPVWPHVKINFNPKASSPYRYCTKATIDKLLKEPK
jgi:prefoldin subunit 5